MQPVTVHACSADQTHIWADVLAQAVTGELIGALNYVTLAELYEEAGRKGRGARACPGESAATPPRLPRPAGRSALKCW